MLLINKKKTEVVMALRCPLYKSVKYLKYSTISLNAFFLSNVDETVLEHVTGYMC